MANKSSHQWQQQTATIVYGQSKRAIDSLSMAKCAELGNQSSVVMKLDLNITLQERICILTLVSNLLSPIVKRLQGMVMTDSVMAETIGRLNAMTELNSERLRKRERL